MKLWKAVIVNRFSPRDRKTLWKSFCVVAPDEHEAERIVREEEWHERCDFLWIEPFDPARRIFSTGTGSVSRAEAEAYRAHALSLADKEEPGNAA